MKSSARDLRNLPIEDQVDKELADNSFAPSKHGTPSCYNKGCRGPLCRKAQRDRVKRYQGSAAVNMFDEYLEARLEEFYGTKKETVA